MLTAVGKSAQFFKGTSSVVSNSLKPLAAAVLAEKKVVVDTKGNPITSYSLQKALPAHNIQVSSGPAGKAILFLFIKT